MAGGLIDWSAINPGPIQPNNTIGSIADMLQAFAERRDREKQAKMLHDQHEQHFQQQMAEKAVDNARADKYHADELGLQREQMGATSAHRQAELAAAADKEAAAAFPQIQAAQAAGDATGVQNLAALHGGQVIQKPPQQSPLVGLPRELGLAMNMGSGDMATNPMSPPGQQIRLAGRVLDLPSKDEMEATRAAASKQRADQFLAQVGPVANTANGQRALRETMAQMNSPTWDAKEDPFKSFQTRMQNLEGQDVTMSGHRMAAANAGAGEGHKETAENQRSLRELRTTVEVWKRDVGLKELSKTWEEANKAASMAKSTSGSAQAAAVEGFIKAARGGAVTGASQVFQQTHMGGLLDRLESKLTAAQNGGFSAGAMADLQKGVQEAKSVIKDAVEERRKAYVDTFYSQEYGGTKANIDNDYASTFGHFGYKVDRHPGTPGISIQGKSYVDKGAQQAPEGGVRKLVNGKPSIVYPDGTYEDAP